jgi:phosphatidylcholine synthase
MLLPWLVHLYTASGAVMALAAVQASAGGDMRAAFRWLLAATFVDASDGWLARRLRVADRLPWIDGRRLDDIVDYLTFVFVPAVVLVRAHLVPAPWDLAIAAAILVVSACGFSRADAKTADHFFTGFPSYWNIVVFYLYAAGLPPVLNAAIVVLLAGLVLVPTGYIYPTRTPVLRKVTIAGSVAWGLVLWRLIEQAPDVSRGLLWWSLAFPVYYAGLSFVLHARRVHRA